jgi:hypothetical protein
MNARENQNNNAGILGQTEACGHLIHVIACTDRVSPRMLRPATMLE